MQIFAMCMWRYPFTCFQHGQDMHLVWVIGSTYLVLCVTSCKFVTFYICRTRQRESVMELAINKHLSGVVSSLCSHRAPVNDVTSKGEPLIWYALETEDYSICDILVNIFWTYTTCTWRLFTLKDNHSVSLFACISHFFLGRMLYWNTDSFFTSELWNFFFFRDALYEPVYRNCAI